MEKPFFIMIYSQDGNLAFPMEEDMDLPKFFKSEGDARLAAEAHGACIAFGYEIFEMGTGD